jgi:hypothetical protein
MTRRNDKIFGFLLSVTLISVVWHFIGLPITAAFWPSINGNAAFNPKLFIQSAIFLLVFPSLLALALFAVFGIWKEVSRGTAACLIVLCLVIPSLFDEGFVMGKPVRSVVAQIGSRQ